MKNWAELLKPELLSDEQSKLMAETLKMVTSTVGNTPKEKHGELTKLFIEAETIFLTYVLKGKEEWAIDQFISAVAEIRALQLSKDWMTKVEYPTWPLQFGNPAVVVPYGTTASGTD